MDRLTLERHQVWLYLAAILAGLILGTLWGGAAMLEGLLWPLLGVLIFVTFTQVPLVHVRRAFGDRRFMTVMLAGNFILVPLIVWGLLWLLPPDPALRLGVLLVLLVPCTDWYITFTHLGGGDTGRAIASTPITLLIQMALLPVWLWLFMGQAFLEIFTAGPITAAFTTLILLPLAAAWLLERWIAARPAGRVGVTAHLGWYPVPLLALVVGLIAASQVGTVAGALPVLPHLAGVFVAYLVLAGAAGVILARAFALPARPARALVFSLGTRNSFVVLPLALALPDGWRLAIVVVVIQSLIELFGMLVYLRMVPGLLPER